MSNNFKIWRESASLIIASKSTFNPSVNYNYKVLCLKRSSKSGVMPNNYVFPGGNISKSDSNTKWLTIFRNSGYDLNSFDELYPVENVPHILQRNEKNALPKFISLRICAIRETFEECGVLICKKRNNKYNENRSGPEWASYIGGHEILQWQNKVHDNPYEFLNLCKQFDLYPDVWALKTWSNWVTPPSVRSKFDTIFFLSTFNQMPDAQPEEKEIQNLMWATPEEYVTKKVNKKIIFPIPQFYELSRLKNFADISKLAKYVNDRSKYGCEMYFPYKVVTKNGSYTIFPGDDFYPKYIDEKITDVPFIEKLPECHVKNRMYHKTEHLNELIIQNLVPKANHLPPKAE